MRSHACHSFAFQLHASLETAIDAELCDLSRGAADSAAASTSAKERMMGMRVISLQICPQCIKHKRARKMLPRGAQAMCAGQGDLAGVTRTAALGLFVCTMVG